MQMRLLSSDLGDISAGLFWHVSWVVIMIMITIIIGFGSSWEGEMEVFLMENMGCSLGYLLQVLYSGVARNLLNVVFQALFD